MSFSLGDINEESLQSFVMEGKRQNITLFVLDYNYTWLYIMCTVQNV